MILFRIFRVFFVGEESIWPDITNAFLDSPKKRILSLRLMTELLITHSRGLRYNSPIKISKHPRGSLSSNTFTDDFAPTDIVFWQLSFVVGHWYNRFGVDCDAPPLTSGLHQAMVSPGSAGSTLTMWLLMIHAFQSSFSCLDFILFPHSSLVVPKLCGPIECTHVPGVPVPLSLLLSFAWRLTNTYQC